jgi:non-ribosomal peptide synthetase-like protein
LLQDSFLKERGVRTLIAQVDPMRLTEEPCELPKWDIKTSDNCYVIFTSGTTGKPKGVLVPHLGVVALVEHNRERFNMTVRDRPVQSAPTIFDASVEEIWLAFATGAPLVVMTAEHQVMGPEMIEWLRAMRITAWAPCPTMLRTVACAKPDQELPELRLLYPGGEALPVDIARVWGKNRHLENAYGPTEATCCCMSTRIVVDKNGELTGPITIGKPTLNQKAFVMDENQQVVPKGEEGELVISGSQVTHGYLKRPDLTAEKFIQIPGEKFKAYRTGDLVKELPDGKYLFLGRADCQVKLHGHRIELESIESHICAASSDVLEAVCDVRETNGSDRLVAFVKVSNKDEKKQIEAKLREALKDSLPVTQIPSIFVFVDSIPRSRADKIDRKQLKFVSFAPEVDDSDTDTETGSTSGTSDDIKQDNMEESFVIEAFAQHLGIKKVDLDADFFELGGNSLLASQVISSLRQYECTKTLVVRDIYNLRTVNKLVDKLLNVAPETQIKNSRAIKIAAGNLESAGPWSRFWCNLAQFLVLIGYYILFSNIAFIFVAFTLPIFTLLDFDYRSIIYVLPLMGITAYVFMWVVFIWSVFVAVCTKWTLIGKYRPGKFKVWGSEYFRHWMVTNFCTKIPMSMVEDTVFKNWVLRALGAKIGKGVHLHKSSFMMDGGWDLLEIGDNVSVGPMVMMKNVSYSGGHMQFARVRIEKNCTVNLGSVIHGGAYLPEGCYVDYFSTIDTFTEASSYQQLTGTPAQAKGPAPEPYKLSPGRSDGMSPVKHAWATVSLQFVWFLVQMMLSSCVLALFMYCMNFTYFDLVILVYGKGITQFSGFSFHSNFILRFFLVVIGATILYMVWVAVQCRLFPTVKPGVYSRWSLWYMLMRIKIRAVGQVRSLLAGSMFYGYWLRLAGAQIADYTEISEIFDVIPELLSIRGHTWTSSVVFFDMPRVHRGLVMCAKTDIGKACYFGNYACVPPGTWIPDNTLIGIMTVAPQNLTVKDEGKSWFGRPAFQLPSREIYSDLDPRMTGDAPPYPQHVVRRFLYEFMRLVTVAALGLYAMFILYSQVYFCGLGAEPWIMEKIHSSGIRLVNWDPKLGANSLTGIHYLFSPVCLAGFVPAYSVLVVVSFLFLTILMKWIMLGKVGKAIVPLWDHWPCRWDYLFIFWGSTAGNIAQAFEGTLFMSVWLRLTGAKIGKNVLWTSGSAGQLSEPDLCHVGDDCIIDGNPWQSHTFEDGVMKRDHLYVGNNCRIEDNCLLLYGCQFYEGSVAYANSGVMKDELLSSYQCYAGCPLVPTSTVTAGQTIRERTKTYARPGWDSIV